MDQTSMLHWWPKVRDLGIPVPKTEIVEIPLEHLVGILDGKSLPEIYTKAILETTDFLGFPLFLRTDMASAKHYWKGTCYVPDRRSLYQHIVVLIDTTLAQGLFGELDPNALVFREYLLLDSAFTAFSGFPISRERRYFVRDGKVECHHPYWIQYAIERSWKLPSKDNWEELLAELNSENETEIEILTSYAEKVGKVLPGYWSVDFALDQKQVTWYLIDMAEGNKSWHPECSVKKEGEY